MTSYTASGARRTGDEYQDLQSAEVLIGWLEQPDLYRRVRLETMDGSLDDIQVECADGTRRLLQVKFGTDPTSEWDWDDLTKQEHGKKGPKPSLLQKWKSSLDTILASGVTVSEAALVTNRGASASIRAHLSDSGIIEFTRLSEPLQAAIAEQLGGSIAASEFFAQFRFFFKERSLESLDDALQRRFQRLGGTSEGWQSLLRNIRLWINRKDEPPPDGAITLADLHEAALWHLPPPIPQDFVVPSDYVAPSDWSKSIVEPRLRARGDSLVVITGSPGAGKSTYLSWLAEQLRSAGIPVVRHHYFLSMTDATPRRTKWETAADAIIGQIRLLYPQLVRSVDGQNPVPTKLREFLTAAGSCREGTDPLVVIVDGLDHVWRDTGSTEDLRWLFDLLLPVPNGVVIVVGTQDIDIAKVPHKLRELCPQREWIDAPPIDRGGVYQWLKYHKNELGLPIDVRHADMVLDELTDAFYDVSSGHPLVLHYTLNAARQGAPSIRSGDVRALLRFDSNSNIATYYRTLWDDISCEGHYLLHLLAGFDWAWPRNGLVQCLAPQGDHARLEQAECAIRHILGISPAGITAFHESLLAFVRELPDHKNVVESLRPQVIEWLANGAPDYWRWRYEWEERAKNGDTESLISSPTLDWCVDSLVDGRSLAEIAEVVAASGWAALAEGNLGLATERHYLDAYLEGAHHSEDVLARLLWLALHAFDSRSLKLELDLFLSRKAEAIVQEIETVAEVAFSAGQLDVCRDLLNECIDRYDPTIQRSTLTRSSVASLEACFPSLFAAVLRNPSEGPYQSYLSQYGSEPPWCSRERYLKALVRHCVVGRDTRAIQTELRFLANSQDQVSFEAVDEIVRLACRDGFDPDRWIEHPEARRSGLFRCCRLWVQDATDAPEDLPRGVSFEPVLQSGFEIEQGAFIELAHAYFFSCLASAAEGHDPSEAVGLDVLGDKVAEFLHLLRDLAIAAAISKNAGQPLGGAWLIDRLVNINPPEVRIHDYNNRFVRRWVVAKIVVAIAQDLEELHVAETGNPSLTRDVIMAAVDSHWTREGVWIGDRVQRRLTMSDSQAARFLIERERIRLEESRDYLERRAEEYAILAQFCYLHQSGEDEVRDMARLAARNLLGHGSHKDLVYFDLLGAILGAPNQSEVHALARLRSISPVIRIMDEITDGDETRYLAHELAEVIGKLVPEALPSYLRALQRDHDDSTVESYFTYLAKSAPLETAFDKALATTLVHEDAVYALQKRADGGDAEAGSVLARTLSFCGRRAAIQEQADLGTSIVKCSEDKTCPPVEDYPPEKLDDFVQAVRDAHVYDDEHLALWTTYWIENDPDGLLLALAAYREAHHYPHETRTANAVVKLALERSGEGSAWDWLVTYHEAMYGWSWHASRLSDVEWIWQFIQSRFNSRWLEFISETCSPRWGTVAGAPCWSIERMVRFLCAVGEENRADEVLDVGVCWGSGLAANILLPDATLSPDQPELPIALQLLVDRLDCPSRMVQERAAWSLAELLANSHTCDATSQALFDWHAAERIEVRSCMLLLILHLAMTAHGVSADPCMDISRKARLVPSIGVDLLLREFGNDGAALATSLSYQIQHSGCPAADFPGIDDFGLIVEAHLAPVFLCWAGMVDRLGITFSRQWEWETVQLALQQGLSLPLQVHSDYHYTGGISEPWLQINDNLSVVLRSAYLRALNWSIDKATLSIDRAAVHARQIAVMADPVSWAVRPSERPYWWPIDSSDADGLDTLGHSIGYAVRGCLEERGLDEQEILLFAAGPVGNHPHFRAELTIRAFLQSPHGPLKPTCNALAGIPEVLCGSIVPRLSLSGTYISSDRYCEFVKDWCVAPIAWRFCPDTNDWLLPDRQIRGIYVPASWLFPDAVTLNTSPQEIRILLDEEQVGHYSYWNDELRERSYSGAGSRTGCKLVVDRKWLEPQLAAGATLCWIATLSITQRGERQNRFSEPQTVGTWLVGGSYVVRSEPWYPPDVP